MNRNKKLSQLDTEQRAHERQRMEQQQSVDRVRSDVEQCKMRCQEVEIRQSTITEQLQQTGFELEQLQAELADEAELEQWQEEVESLSRRINQLGPINLAAIEEFKEQSERKQYLDAQNDDLESALTTLENAIKKIDKETRDRFKETFDQGQRPYEDSISQIVLVAGRLILS